jgi:hypothetical protein
MRPKLYRSPLRYPTYIYAHEVAALVGWNPQRVIRLWTRNGIAMKLDNTSTDSRGRNHSLVVTTPEKLQMLWPEQWEAILDKLEEGRLPR